MNNHAPTFPLVVSNDIILSLEVSTIQLSWNIYNNTLNWFYISQLYHFTYNCFHDQCISEQTHTSTMNFHFVQVFTTMHYVDLHIFIQSFDFQLIMNNAFINKCMSNAMHSWINAWTMEIIGLLKSYANLIVYFEVQTYQHYLNLYNITLFWIPFLGWYHLVFHTLTTCNCFNEQSSIHKLNH